MALVPDLTLGPIVMGQPFRGMGLPRIDGL